MSHMLESLQKAFTRASKEEGHTSATKSEKEALRLNILGQVIQKQP